MDALLARCEAVICTQLIEAILRGQNARGRGRHLSDLPAVTESVSTALDALPGWAVQTQTAPSTTPCGDYLVGACDSIRAIAPSWPVLADLGEAASGFAFQCRDHLEIWLETIGAGLQVKPTFVSVYRKSGEPVMLLAFGIEKNHGVRMLKFLDGGVADYNAPILYPAAGQLTAAETGALWKAICKALPSFDVAVLEKMPEYVGSIKNPLHILAQSRWHISGHYMHLRQPGQDQVRPPNIKDSRRKRRRLSERGEVVFSIAHSEREIAAVYQAFLRQKSRRYMETLGHPGFDVPGQISYYLTLTQRQSERGVQLAYLRVGEEIVATAWSLIAGRRFYYMMAGYEDGIWRTHSPSWLLLEELVNWSSHNNIDIFDFGIGDESYKLKWQETEMALWGGIHPRTLLGWSYVTLLHSYHRSKKSLPRSWVCLLKSLRNRLQSRAAHPQISAPQQPKIGTIPSLQLPLQKSLQTIGHNPHHTDSSSV